MRTTRTFRSASRTILAGLLALTACAATERYSTLSVLEATPLVVNGLSGNTSPVHDPSIIRQNTTYYLFTSDPINPIPDQYLPIRCSTDKITWSPCGQVFRKLPAWASAIPGVSDLWAPDISYFGGLYHLYFAASTAGSQTSIIGLATNTTLDPSDPTYQWIDSGPILTSHQGDDFNAIDPNILVDSDQRVWLTYGSYWTGIKQREIDSSTGLLLASNPVRYQLAARPGTPDDAIEGSSLIHHGSFYYLFLSVDHCCESSTSADDYKQIVGRSSSPNGPFVDATGAPLTNGGGSILLQGNSAWLAPGGGTAYLDAESGDNLLVFHALDTTHNATPALWLKAITWQNDWPHLN
jgi:arabinan endo-1,5-alpha-L-arabinosidase